MKFTIISKLVLAILLLNCGICNAANCKFAESKNDSIYNSLLDNRLEFKGHEARLNIELDSLRKSYSVAPDSIKVALSERILSIESQLYEVRAQIAEADFKINAIEQKNLMSAIRGDKENQETPNQPTETNFKKSRYLLDNRFLIQNLPIEEFRKLRNIQENESLVKELVVAFKNNYAKLNDLKLQYDSVKTQAQADSLFNEYLTLTAQSVEFEDSLSRIWIPCYDTKIYAYSYLLDKINRIDLLEELNNKLQANQVSSADYKDVQSQQFAMLGQQKSAILNYELTLAEVLDLSEAADSLNSEHTYSKDSMNLMLPRIELQPLDFTPYSRVTTTPEHPYSVRNPIPKHERPQVPVIYKILLGTFLKVQPISIFRKVSPLSLERLANGRYRYYAGLYKNYDEMMEDIDYLKTLGFRRPEPVVWENGEFRNLAEDVGKAYRVEFKCKDNLLNDKIKEQLNLLAQGKETSRVNAEMGVTYIIGIFESRIEAMKLVEALNKLEEVTAKVSEAE